MYSSRCRSIRAVPTILAVRARVTGCRKAVQVPRATYRLQLSAQFGFAHLHSILPYLARLGISHLYLSPIFKARPGSSHGYDVVDHGQLNAELGDGKELEELALAARNLGMGIVLDIVPNHMAVMTDSNVWWADVLENGRSSRFAAFFDIDWRPARESMRNRLLVPVLGGTFGDTIERGEIRVHFDPAAGAFALRYQEHSFPLDPRHYPLIFAAAGHELAQWSSEDSDRQDFDSLMDAFAALPETRDIDAESVERRYRDKEVNKRRLVRLCERRSDLLALFGRVLAVVNGDSGESSSRDALAALLERQPYRLAFWRVSGEEINYRRFFDVNELAALRMEDPSVFQATHSLLLALVQSNVVEGIRVDHADGLHDPKRYFQRLAEEVDLLGGAPCWTVAEKVLAVDEQLPADWPIDGTTGYEFGALVSAWLMRADQVPALERTYRRHVGNASSFDAIAYQSKKDVMRGSLAAEISVLAAQLDRVAQLHRSSSDFTVFDLREAVVETIACFPVYRTYVSSEGATSTDRQIIGRAVGLALSRRAATRRALEFLRDVLCGQLNGVQRKPSLDFTMKFQQVTGPVMAKGVEDTAFYRYSCLLALNEVGSDPGGRLIDNEQLHRASAERARQWPNTMLASSTHDSKRGEDASWRLAALAENVAVWRDCLARWRRLKRRARVAAQTISAADEYLLLQTALSIWPLSAAPQPEELATLRARIEEYAVKAAREAKLSTTWFDPDPEYEKALKEFVGTLIPNSRTAAGFQRYFQPVIDAVAWAGVLNALAATVLKLTTPGVPDLYQGAEVPHLALVDPDSRRAVDWQRLESGLASLAAQVQSSSARQVAARLLGDWRSGALKQFVIWRLLELRRSQAQLFASNGYEPLVVQGEHAARVVAFLRNTAGAGMRHGAIIVVVARWVATLVADGSTVSPVWRETQIQLPADTPLGRWTDALTGVVLEVGEPRLLSVAECFATLPAAVLVFNAAAPGMPP